MAIPTAAILDRFLHHAPRVIFSGRSYRLKDMAAGQSAPVEGGETATAVVAQAS